MISYAEFCELTSTNENNAIEPEEAIQPSPERKQIQRDIERSPVRRHNSREDLIPDSLDEHMDKVETAEKKKLDEEKKELLKKKLENTAKEDDELERKHQKNSSFRFLNLLKYQLKLEKELDIYRETLFCHTSFNLIDTFKFFDIQNKGFITCEDLDKVAKENQLSIDS